MTMISRSDPASSGWRIERGRDVRQRPDGDQRDRLGDAAATSAMSSCAGRGSSGTSGSGRSWPSSADSPWTSAAVSSARRAGRRAGGDRDVADAGQRADAQRVQRDLVELAVAGDGRDRAQVELVARRGEQQRDRSSWPGSQSTMHGRAINRRRTPVRARGSGVRRRAEESCGGRAAPASSRDPCAGDASDAASRGTPPPSAARRRARALRGPAGRARRLRGRPVRPEAGRAPDLVARVLGELEDRPPPRPAERVLEQAATASPRRSRCSGGRPRRTSQLTITTVSSAPSGPIRTTPFSPSSRKATVTRSALVSITRAYACARPSASPARSAGATATGRSRWR